MSRILFVSCTFPPDNSATAGVLKKIIPFLQRSNCQIDAITIKQSFHDSKYLMYNNCNIYRADCVLYTPSPKKDIRDLFFAIRKKIKNLIQKNNKTTLFKENVVRKILSQFKKINFSEYDVIISVCAYYDAAEATIRYIKKHKLSIPIILYQVDPLSENMIYNLLGKKYLNEYEQKLFDLCSCVFTTPAIMNQKKNQNWSVNKLIPVEFPLAENPQINSNLHKSQDEIRCVFTGMLYGALRDARFTLELFSQFLDPRIHLYLIGYGQEELISEYVEGKMKGRLHFFGEKSEEECNQWLASADILVNIGNSVMNQTPSKLFQYMSFGKPILNIVKNGQCPSIPYMERYPFSNTVIDTTTVCESDARNSENWIVNNKSNHIDYQSIKDLFYTCSPEYIAKQMLDEIKKCSVKKHNELM